MIEGHSLPLNDQPVICVDSQGISHSWVKGAVGKKHINYIVGHKYYNGIGKVQGVLPVQ